MVGVLESAEIPKQQNLFGWRTEFRAGENLLDGFAVCWISPTSDGRVEEREQCLKLHLRALARPLIEGRRQIKIEFGAANQSEREPEETRKLRVFWCVRVGQFFAPSKFVRKVSQTARAMPKMLPMRGLAIGPHDLRGKFIKYEILRGDGELAAFADEFVEMPFLCSGRSRRQEVVSLETFVGFCLQILFEIARNHFSG